MAADLFGYNAGYLVVDGVNCEGYIAANWKEKETKMQSYSYEVVVHEKRDEDDKVVREAKIIDSGSGLLEKPDEFKLLIKNAEKLKDIGREEVSVNIRPFCG